MRAVVYPEPNKFEIRDDIPRPVPKHDELLVRVKSTTICATDFKVFAGKFPGTTFPHIPGHEWSGEVVELGEGVSGYQVGDRVGVEIHVGCGKCENCMMGYYNLCENYGKKEVGHGHIGISVPGGMAEYCTVPTKAAHKLPANLTFDEGAFTDNIGIALHAVERAQVQAGDGVVVIGPGAFGLLAVQVARAMGARKIVLVGTRRERLDLGVQLGADVAIDIRAEANPIAAVRGLFGGKGCDAVVEFAGSEEAAVLALQVVKRGGRVALGGATGPGRMLHIDLSVIVRGHLNVCGSLANPKWVSRRGLELIERGYVDVKPLITHHMPLRDFGQAWETFEQRKGGAIRVMLHPDQG